MATCSICREGTLKPGKVTVTLERDGAILLFKLVPANVCNNCESHFLTSETTREVLKKAESSFQNGTELEVIRHSAAA